MRFTVARADLLDALTVAGKGLSSRSTLPILSGILISAAPHGTVTLEATDLEVSIRRELSFVSVEREGTVVVAGKLTGDIVRSLPEAAVTLAVEGEVLSISCLQASFTLRTLPVEDFPRFPEAIAEKSIALPAATIVEIVKHVARAVSRDETRPVLTGVLVTIEGDTVRMASTDSYRLAVKDSHVEREGPLEDIQLIVPGKVLEEVSRLAPESESVTIGVNESQAIFSFGNTEFVARRIQGAFPNYKQLIPKEAETHVTVNRQEVVSAVKRVSLLAQHNAPIRITVSEQDQTVNFSAQTTDVGDASEDVMATVEGKDVEIAFNHAFLLDGLAASDAESLRIDIVSPLKPGVITNPADDGFLYLLMPVRLG